VRHSSEPSSRVTSTPWELLPFAARGDSGSLIFDRYRRLGLLWGGHRTHTPDVNRRFNLSLEVPMQDLGDNIQDLIFYTVYTHGCYYYLHAQGQAERGV
jgi:hypothetical protein